MNKGFENAVSVILGDYFSTCQYKPLDVSITIADDIWKAYFDVRPDHAYVMLSGQNPLPKLNGTIAAPINLDGRFTIIIDAAYFAKEISENRVMWIGTIVHETKHAIDYRDYAQIISASSYDEVLDTSKHRMFHLWTEFNAKRHGYYFLRKYAYKGVTDPSQISDIINIELPGQTQYMISSYGATTDAWTQLYVVSQFLGRLAVWEDLFPSTFNREFIVQLLGATPWMLETYDYLNSHRVLAESVESFDDLREIVRQNFPGA